LFAVACLEYCLSDIEVRTLDETIGSRVVSRNANVLDVVMLLEVFEGFEESWAVVGYDLE
jgi:hypothetical protein